MGLGSLFQKKTNYFDKQMAPQCGYCQFGKRTKEGNRILCEKAVSIKEQNDSCNKFVYSPLKRVPVKQMKNEGFVADEEIYVEVVDKEPEKKPEPAPIVESAVPAAPVVEAPAAQPAPADEIPAPAVQPAPAVEAAVPTAPVVEAPASPVVEAAAPVQEPIADAPAAQASLFPGFGNLNELAQAAALAEETAADTTQTN